ncbi:TIGR01212 family radical SAM protein [Desulfoferula mesophila]|uniref:TIGR01212 family radical SAM protein n=1 Tax=Desulfoferula mesophila TaxID=3058419 RepID=A0AAU9EMW0_9BACT|nr:TIGR01212 family radical SAM protein [Desulfoferula mesophilus]
MDAARLASRVNLLGPWLRRVMGGPARKISLDPGLGCPHRPEGVGPGGCLYCPPGGSGPGRGGTLSEQLEHGLDRLRARRGPTPRALAYFQAYTATNAPAQVLEPLFMEVARHPAVAGIIVATRPDCLPPATWELLAELARRRPLWLELGLQSAHDATLTRINRGHDVACFDQALAQAHARGLRVVAHVILGLPGEDMGHTNATARHLAQGGVWGVKLHNLMVLAGAPLAHEHRAGGLALWNQEEYARAAAAFLARLPRRVLVHRLAADPGPDRLLAPGWAADKDAVLRAIAQAMEEDNLRQGDLA